jgi:hypothetical protein
MDPSLKRRAELIAFALSPKDGALTTAEALEVLVKTNNTPASSFSAVNWRVPKRRSLPMPSSDVINSFFQLRRQVRNRRPMWRIFHIPHARVNSTKAKS